MALSAAKIKVELREISLKNRPNALYQISSKGTVPVLNVSKNKIIDESLEIMIWCIEQSNLDWLQIDSQEQLSTINNNDNDFKFWLDRYKYADRYPDSSIEEYQDNCKNILLKYESTLSKTKYLYTNKIQLADIAIFPFIRQCENVNQIWFSDNFPILNCWLQNIKKSNLFLSVMNKYSIWNIEDCGFEVEFDQKN